MAEPEAEGVRTTRLVVRPPREADRERFVELFGDADYMVFYPEVLSAAEASER